MSEAERERGANWARRREVKCKLGKQMSGKVQIGEKDYWMLSIKQGCLKRADMKG